VNSTAARDAIRRRPDAASAFTLEPAALFVEGADLADLDPATWATKLSTILLDDDTQPSPRGREIADAWASSHQELAMYQRSVTMPKEHVRINARARLLRDLTREIASAAQAVGLGEADLSRWLLEEADESIATMPYVGRLQEIIRHRLSNADDRWEPNDLNDAHFLACAAAYADVVVGEKKTIEYLRRAARRCVPGAEVCRRVWMRGLLERIENDDDDSRLARPAEEPKLSPRGLFASLRPSWRNRARGPGTHRQVWSLKRIKIRCCPAVKAPVWSRSAMLEPTFIHRAKTRRPRKMTGVFRLGSYTLSRGLTAGRHGRTPADRRDGCGLRVDSTGGRIDGMCPAVGAARPQLGVRSGCGRNRLRRACGG
jgi:hypothetical protein